MTKTQLSISSKPRFTKKGFSFIEVMLASFLLVVGVLASVTLLTKGLKESLDSRSQLTAALLAQEGVELVRNIRDNNWLATPARTSFANLPSLNLINDYCKIDLSNSSLADASCNVPSATDIPLYISTTTKLYNAVQSGTPTRFKRKIAISYDVLPAASATSATVTSMVIWGTTFPALTTDCNSARKCAFVTVTMTNWGAK